MKKICFLKNRKLLFLVGGLQKLPAFLLFVVFNVFFAQNTENSLTSLTIIERIETDPPKEPGKIYIVGSARIVSLDKVISNIVTQDINYQQKNDFRKSIVKNKPSEKKSNFISEAKLEKEKNIVRIKKTEKIIAIKTCIAPNNNGTPIFNKLNHQNFNAVYSNIGNCFDIKTIHQISLSSNLELIYQKNIFYYDNNRYQLNFFEHHSVRPPPCFS